MFSRAGIHTCRCKWRLRKPPYSFLDSPKPNYLIAQLLFRRFTLSPKLLLNHLTLQYWGERQPFRAAVDLDDFPFLELAGEQA